MLFRASGTIYMFLENVQSPWLTIFLEGVRLQEIIAVKSAIFCQETDKSFLITDAKISAPNDIQKNTFYSKQTKCPELGEGQFGGLRKHGVHLFPRPR